MPRPIIQWCIIANRGISLTLYLQNGWNALHAASQEGHDEVVKILMRAKAGLNLQNNVSTQRVVPCYIATTTKSIVVLPRHVWCWGFFNWYTCFQLKLKTEPARGQIQIICTLPCHANLKYATPTFPVCKARYKESQQQVVKQLICQVLYC